MRSLLPALLPLALLAPLAAATHDDALVRLDPCVVQVLDGPVTPCDTYVVAADVADPGSDGNTWLFVKAAGHSVGAGAGPQPGSDGNSWYVTGAACAPGAGCKGTGDVVILP